MVVVVSDRLTTMALMTLTLPRSSRTVMSMSIAVIAAVTWAGPAGGGEADLLLVVQDEADGQPALGHGRADHGRGRAGDGVDRVVAGVGDPADPLVFECGGLAADPGSGFGGEAGPDVDVDVVGGGEFDGAGLQDARAGVGELEHLFVADRGEFARTGDHPGIGGEDPGHVGEDVAVARAQRGGEGDRGGVGAAPAQRGEVTVAGYALKAGDQHDRALVQGLGDPVGGDVPQPRVAVGVVGDDAGLGAGQ